MLLLFDPGFLGLLENFERDDAVSSDEIEEL